MRQPRIRGGYQRHEPYPLNEFPLEVIQDIAKSLIYLKAIGYGKLEGDTFCRMFADAIGGISLDSPLGIADVIWNGCGWSVKTVKNANPHKFTVGRSPRQKRVRLISGRNSPVYSLGIENPFDDVQETGDAVISIYNSRIGEAQRHHADMRFLVFLRNFETQEFSIFERPIIPYAVNDYEWRINQNDNFEAYREGEHSFTWQPHGSRFTIVEPVPDSATRFKIVKTPQGLDRDDVLEVMQFEPDWIEIL